ncbi:MAG TPA: SpoIIE family protein phosphatase [Gemmataceae bacterium]|nr:SpoIIE family protein phosphatase [Gemmataceae bacterium]
MSDDGTAYAQDIVDTIREPLLILDATLRVRSANRAFYRSFRVSPAETEGRLIYELGNGQWDSPALRTLLKDVVPADSVFDGFELAHDFPRIGLRVMLLNARRMRPGPHAGFLVLALEDVTEARRATETADQATEAVAEAHRRMSEDLRVAARVQAAYLPADPPEVPGAVFAWAYRPCDELGGDGLNVVQLDEGRVALFVLDASGHGVAAALLAVAMSRVLLTLPARGRGLGGVTPPAQMAERLNRLFPFDPATHQFATLMYGILDVPAREFRYTSAGHPGPIHLPTGEPPALLVSPGYPIGLADGSYAERALRLAAGDRLYLYSDGLPEAMSPAGEPFGDARLLAAVDRGRAAPLAAAVAALRDEVEQWCGGGGPQDDVSIVAAEISAELNQ